MKQIEVEVRWCDKNYCGGWGDPEIGAILSTGRTLDDFKKDFEDALIFHIEGMEEDGNAPEWQNDYQIIYRLHISAVLRQAEAFTTMSVVSRISGVNPTLIRQYASSRKEPRFQQRAKIIDALHTIGRTMLTLE